MTKTFIVDTCVLISFPDCLSKIQGNMVVPVVVLEELDRLKSSKDGVSHKARQAIRNIDEICKTGDPAKGIKLPTGFTFKVDTRDYGSVGEHLTYGDNKILSLLIKKKTYTLLSQDISLRLRARSYGIAAEPFARQEEVLYTGVVRLPWSSETDQLLFSGKIDAKELGLRSNEFCFFYDQDGNDVLAARNVNGSVKVVQKKEFWGISGRNLEQCCAMDALSDPNLPLVSICGEAGSGKTLLTLSVALDLVISQKKFNKIIIYRPIQEVGNSIGYLPGSKFEKLEPYFAPIFDNLEALLSSGKRNKDWRTTLDMFLEKGIIEFEAMTYVRGRSISNALIIIDEMQNLRSEDALTMLSRIGRSTRVFINGDIKQIDARNLNQKNNAIATIAEKFKDSKLSAHITLEDCLRSELASEAIKLLA